MSESSAWVVIRESVWDDEVPEVLAVALDEQDATAWITAYEAANRHPADIVCWRYTPRAVPLIATGAREDEPSPPATMRAERR